MTASGTTRLSLCKARGAWSIVPRAIFNQCMPRNLLPIKGASSTKALADSGSVAGPALALKGLFGAESNPSKVLRARNINVH